MESRSVQAPPLHVVTIGHVDHGKSTLVGRLLHDAGGLPKGQIDAIRAMCDRRGMPFEWAFITDACQAERDQGITIDVAEARLRQPDREYVFVDAPGHREFIRNMITGAARADGALLLIDASEGVREQTRLHGMLAQLIGLRNVVVVVNKMDLIGFDAARFREISGIISTYLAALKVTPLAIIPISARDGDNVVNKSGHTPWFTGPSVMEAIRKLPAVSLGTNGPLRLPLQDIYKFDERRVFAGRILSGRLRVGDRLRFMPSDKISRVKTIEAWPATTERREARAGDSVGFTLEDQIFVERGQIACLSDEAPVVTNTLVLRVFWMATEPLAANEPIVIKHATHATPAIVREIRGVIDTDTLAPRSDGQKMVGRFSVAEILVRTQALLAADTFDRQSQTGRVILLRNGNVVGCGLILETRPLAAQRAETANLSVVSHEVDAAARAGRNGHRGGVIWLTGLSGSGKSTIAMGVERELFRLGYQSYVLDGDNVRRGLNRDLGFTARDRTENIRRVGEMAALFADAGFIVITSFISPYQSDRDTARQAAGDDFREVYIKADVPTCERRDPKGLYKKARAGAIPDFTGVSAPYEEPITPELVVDTMTRDAEACIQAVTQFIRREFGAS